MRYTLRQLEIFLATAHTENLSRAAEALAMSQSAASGALKELEQQFDIHLFDRIGKRLQLNDFGRALQPRAEELLARARELEAALGRQVEAAALRVGATLSIGNYLAVPMVTDYMARYGGSRVSLEVANTHEITEKVAHYDLDVGLIEGEIHHADLLVTPWLDDELVVFCAPSHPLASERSLSDPQLLSAKWIVREPGSGTRQTFDRAMHGLLPELDVVLELQHTEAIKRAVEAGFGLGCLSRITLTEALKRGSLCELKVPSRDFTRRFYWILHKQKYQSIGIERWLQLCKEQQPAGAAY